jgi:hypothetical protein
VLLAACNDYSLQPQRSKRNPTPICSQLFNLIKILPIKMSSASINYDQYPEPDYGPTKGGFKVVCPSGFTPVPPTGFAWHCKPQSSKGPQGNMWFQGKYSFSTSS